MSLMASQPPETEVRAQFERDMLLNNQTAAEND